MRKILLKSGDIAFVDNEDYSRVSKFKWHSSKRGHTTYVVRRVKDKLSGKQKTIYLHREILNLKTLKNVVDHVNHNGLDNRKINLRICTQRQNVQHSRRRSDNTSQCKGVGWFKPKEKWRARISVDGQRIHLGYFGSISEARVAYTRAAQKYFGQFSITH